MGQLFKLVEAAAVVGVDEVEPDGGVAHQRLARPRRTDIDLVDREFLRSAVVVNPYCRGHDRAP